MCITTINHLVLHVGVECVQNEFQGCMKETCARVEANVIVQVLCFQYVLIFVKVTLAVCHFVIAYFVSRAIAYVFKVGGI